LRPQAADVPAQASFARERTTPAPAGDRPTAPLAVAVLVSGTGTNLVALTERLPRELVEIVGVASNRADAAALARAAERSLATAVFELADYPDRERRDAAMADWLERRGARLVVLAGYMHLLTPRFLARFPRRVVNVHPSLLPAFPGRAAVADALAAGVRETGVTVHLVDEGIDSGPILAQEAVPVLYDDAPASLLERLHEVEHRLLPDTVRAIAEGRLQLGKGMPR
jgi:phosphoribosylglycinamide formyltransferase-1